MNDKTKKMKANLLLMLLFATILIIGISSCKKKGCTNSNACNYDKTAEKDDGSCKRNHVSFWKKTSNALEDIVVTINVAQHTGVSINYTTTSDNITADFVSEPDCYAAGCATFYFCDGVETYSYTASEKSPGAHNWSGTFTTEENGCVSVELK